MANVDKELNTDPGRPDAKTARRSRAGWSAHLKDRELDARRTRTSAARRTRPSSPGTRGDGGFGASGSGRSSFWARTCCCSWRSRSSRCCSGFGVSFFRWTIIEPPVFVGLDNYQPVLLRAIRWPRRSSRNSLVYTLGALPISVLLPLGLAVLLNSRHPRHRLLPRHLLPAAGDLGCRRGHHLQVDLRQAGRSAQPAGRPVRHPAPGLAVRREAGAAGADPDGDLAPRSAEHHLLSGRAPGCGPRRCTRPPRSTARTAGSSSGTSPGRWSRRRRSSC